MPNNDRIRTPWIHKWRRFRYSVMPALCFVAFSALTAYLWQQQGELPNAVASGDSVNITIRATADSTLHEASHWWNRFDPALAGRGSAFSSADRFASVGYAQRPGSKIGPEYNQAENFDSAM